VSQFLQSRKRAKGDHHAYNSSRSRGVALSQEKDKKKSITRRIGPKNMHSQVNFTEYSQACEVVQRSKFFGLATHFGEE